MTLAQESQLDSKDRDPTGWKAFDPGQLLNTLLKQSPITIWKADHIST